ncbi:MAG: DUF3047 domain-containing protein [Nitrosomonas sp.]|nr:DUF3047 domain-containing protein [Nitrosomonas sp.]
MIDTDNAGAAVTAWYGDIWIAAKWTVIQIIE